MLFRVLSAGLREKCVGLRVGVVGACSWYEENLKVEMVESDAVRG